MFIKNRIMTVLLSFAFLFGSGYKLQAQYFGQNKVQYDNFKFKELHTKHFDIYFYPEEETAIDYAAIMAERWYARHRQLFPDSLKGKQPLILYGSFPQFQETNVTQGFIGQGTGGFTEPLKRRIVLPFAGPLKETDHVIGHELVHAFQYNLTNGAGPGSYSGSSLQNTPLWLIEGMAEYFSLGPDDPFTAMWMRDAALKELPDISDLDNPKYFPYRYGQSLLAYIGGKWGDNKIIELLKSSENYKSINTAIDSVLLISPDSLSNDWHTAIHTQYDSIKTMTSVPTDYGPLLIGSDEEGEELNISPVLSPDGRSVAFYSSRDLFSINIFLADTKTGEIKKTILKTELDPHLQSLEFINSTGAWNPEGNKFVFSTVKNGRPSLSILNINSDEIEHEIRFENLGEIYNPTWSPDGNSIAFSALDNGFSNLFIYKLEEDTLEQLTDDAFAELQPQWSPDGKTIAFVTDRFTTNISDLDIGQYQIALINPKTKVTTSLTNFLNAKNINPQWSENGESIYFLSDNNGITNIYRLDLNTKQITQITNLYGGVSGITSISPAISVASGKIVYSAYKNGKYNIYSIDESTLTPRPRMAEFSDYDPGILPPSHRLDRQLIKNIHNPDINLPRRSQFRTTDYDASLSLTGIVQPSLAVGVDRFGANIGGGVGLLWSDMLSNHNLSTMLQIQSYSSFKFTDISAFIGYLNTSSRWNWGGYISQIPYVSNGFNTGYGTINGVPSYIEQQVIIRQINRELKGIISYPFSQVLRIEFSGGYQNISFQNELVTRASSLNDGSTVLNKTDNLSAPSALNMGIVGTALVYDNSLFGATSPILGQRFRFDVSPSFGSLNMTNLLVDFRKYIVPFKPFTLAGRILHLGRYGKDSEDGRLLPLFLGYPGLVRGYQSDSYNAGECGPDSNGFCPALDKLEGSKMLLTNLELRFPLFGVFGLGSGYYGFFPVEFGVFYDAGITWSSNQKPSFLGGNRKPVSSFGGALRINLFGAAVAEIDYVHPFSRPGDKWLWQFNLIQGF